MDHTYTAVSKHKYLILLAMIYVVVNTVPTLFLYRLVKIGDFVVPGGMFVYPLIYMLCDIVAEVYGYRIARLFIWYGILCNFFFAICALSIVYLPVPPSLPMSNEYYDVFHNVLHADIANLMGVLVGNTLNAYALSKWKILLSGRYFALRSITSNIVGEAVMLIIWGFIAFYGRLPLHDLLKLIVSDYVIRVIYALIVVTPAAMIIQFIKKHENIDVYDYHTNFNMFNLSLKDKQTSPASSSLGA